MLSFLKRKKKDPYILRKTYTYYIPAPPKRKSGYREREFDHIIDHLNQNDFDLLEIKTQSHHSHEASGIWVICILGAKTNHAVEFNLDFNYEDISEKVMPSTEHSFIMDENIIYE